jgi:hypothetical protein
MNFKQFILENPDRVTNSIWWRSSDSRTFGYIGNKFFISKTATNHPDFAVHLLNKKEINSSDLPEMGSTGEVSRSSFKYPGRLWTLEKIISFWVFPNKNDFDKLIEDLKKNGINIDDSWKIDTDSGMSSKLIPISEYTDKFKEKKVKQVQHLVDPMFKVKDKNIKPGYTKMKLKGFNSFAQYNAMKMTSESVENKNDKYILFKNQKGDNSHKEFYRDEYGTSTEIRDLAMKYSKTHAEQIIKRSPEWKMVRLRDLYEEATTTAPTSVSTGQFQGKPGSVAKRKDDEESDEKEDLKDKIKKKIKKKMNEGMVKHLDFAAKTKKAKTMSDEALEHSIKDCMDCVDKGIDQGYYQDEASVYRQELNKRKKLKKKLDESAENPNEEKEIMKKYFVTKDSDKNTKMYRSENKWVKVLKDGKKFHITLGRKGELSVPKGMNRLKETSDKDMMEVYVSGWFKHND